VPQPEIVMVGPMPPLVTEQLDAGFTVHKLWLADDPDALIGEISERIVGIATAGHKPIDASFMDRFPNLRIVSNFGVGYDSVDAAHAGTRGVVVTNTPDVLTEEVADTAYGLMLMTVRELSAAERYLRDGKWLDGAYPLTRGSLQNRSLGIVGLGRIGKAIARRAEASGMAVSYHGRSRQSDVAYPYYATAVELARAVDTLMIVVPGGADTQHMIGREVFEALGPEGIVINVGRGSVVDEKALIAALKDGTILSAGLDVFETEPCRPDELIAMDRVVLLPHVGSASIHTRARMGQLVVDNLVETLAGRKPLSPVAETPVG